MKKNGKLHVNKNYVDIGYEKHTCRQEDSLKLPRSAEGTYQHADRNYGNCMPTGNMGTACRHAGELHADRKNA